MSEPGFWTLNDQEAAGLRAYLAKGGFLIFDDFRQAALVQLRSSSCAACCRRSASWSSTPRTRSSTRSSRSTRRRFVPPYGGDTPIFYGVFEDNDPAKRLLVIANYNNDLGEYWEFSDTGWVPIDLSNEAYKFGVNYIVYGMTH